MVDKMTRDAFLNTYDFIEQFADAVVSCTSQYNNSLSISYAPENIMGKPLKYPNYGDFPETYTLRTYGKWWSNSEAAQEEYMPQDVGAIEAEDYFIVKFEHPVKPDSIFVYETFNPGAIVRLWGGNNLGKWVVLWEGLPQYCSSSARKFCPKLKHIDDLINYVRIEFNQSLLQYHTSIDAVLLCGYKPRSLLQANMALYGMPKVQSGDIKKEVVIKKEEITTRIDGSDPFAVLPHEIVVYIFSFLDLCSLCRCAQVNRRFREASQDGVLYKNLCFKRYWHLVTSATIASFIPKCTALKKLDLSWCGTQDRISVRTFGIFLEQCGKQLTHLSVRNCDFISDVSQILPCRNLTDLRLRNCQPSNWETFSSLALLTKLQVLDLGCTNIYDEALLKILKNNSQLIHLNIDLCEYIEDLNNIVLTVAERNKDLRTFCCWKAGTLSSDSIRALSACTDLRELDVGWCLMVTDPGDCLLHLSKGCNKLRRVVFSGWRALTDTHLLPVLNFCKGLEEIDLVGVRNITADICNKALSYLIDLKLLDVSFCDSITQEQVLMWSSRYPNVTIQRSEEQVMSEEWDYNFQLV